MAITPAEGEAIVDAVLDAFGEDYPTMGRLIYHLRLALPSVNWEALLASRAATHQPFIDSGLSIDWWVTEVIRQADSIG